MVVAEPPPRLQTGAGATAPDEPGDEPLASVVVVNWQGEAYLTRCLESLLAQTLPGVEVIVVDNASTDDGIAMVRRSFGERVGIVALDRNEGYAGGANAGFAVARGRYVALLNNDAFPEPPLLEEMVRVAEQDPRIGMVACKTLAAEDPSIIDTAGHLIYGDCVSRGRGRLEPDDGRYDRVEEVIFPSGSACLYRAAMLAELGGMDHALWMFMEDSDLGLRARLAGWRAVFAPAARVHHLYSASVGKYSTLKAYQVERNHVWVCMKVLPPQMLVPAAGYTAIRLGMQAVGMLSGRGAAARFGEDVSKWTVIATVLRAYRDALIGLPRALRQRREIRGSRRISDREFAALFRRFRLSSREVAWRD